MARQIQLRRGTAAQHENFTGADGEVTVDTTNHTLRVHDGQTVGGTALMRADAMDAADYVVAFQAPTAANGYTWYRKYKSGWVEQGGWVAASATDNNTVFFPYHMANDKYSVTIVSEVIAGGEQAYRQIYTKEITSMNLTNRIGGYTAYSWSVSGQAA